MYTNILIATDGSDVALNGLDHGLSLARSLSSKVTVVTVTEPFPLIAGATASGWAAGPEAIVRYEAGQEAFAKGVLLSAKATAERAGVAVETIHIADRWPADAIVEVAAMRGCDLIVMASHGRRGLGRLLLGSQTAEVLAHSKIPVLVVR
jgi:nucleotide-binding universal stress UspA family protein